MPWNIILAFSFFLFLLAFFLGKKEMNAHGKEMDDLENAIAELDQKAREADELEY